MTMEKEQEIPSHLNMLIARTNYGQLGTKKMIILHTLVH